jgi:(p)ppGpp synthase/HD superfamily hydrolase
VITARRAGERRHRPDPPQAPQRRRRRGHHHAEPAPVEGLARVRRDEPRTRPDPRAFPQEQRDKSTSSGKELLEKEMHSAASACRGCSSIETSCARCWRSSARARRTSCSSPSATASSPAKAITDFLSPKDGERESEPPANLREGRLESLVRKRVTGRTSHGIVLNGVDDVLVRYTKCCNPLPGDEIVGFITRGRGVTVHRRNCTKAFDTDPDRRVEIQWDARAKINRPVQVRVTTQNRPGILATSDRRSTRRASTSARPPAARETTAARATRSRSCAPTSRS